MPTERVLITGIGVVSPIGVDRASFWEAALAGRSGVARVDNPWIEAAGLATRIAAQVRGFDPVAAGIPAKDIPLLDPTSLFALAAAREAISDAGFSTQRSNDNGSSRIDGVDPYRVGVVVGSGIGGLRSFETYHGAWRETRDKHAVKRYALPMLIPNAPAGQTAIRFGARGECKSVSTACAAGTMAIGDAYRLLRDGEADVVLAGGAEGLASDQDGYSIVGFERLRTLSVRNDDPARASRPFDKLRDGFVLGEGAAVLVLERESHARSRGVPGYAAILGYAANCDAVSMMQLDESGDGIVALIRAALASAGRSVDEVDHVSAHGTSTVLNDRTEAKALRRVFGPHVADVSVTALKSMTGHAVGASGPLEVAALAMSLRAGVLTPTINYEIPDPECDLDIVANRPRDARPALVIKMSYGFGGHNGCLVLSPV